MKYPLCALAALAVCVLPAGSARAENKVEIYYQGSILPFGRFEKRFVCDMVEPIEAFLTSVRTYEEKKAYVLIREPVKEMSEKAIVLQDDITRLHPAGDLLTTFCRQAPKQLFIVGAVAIQWFDGHEVTSVMVMDGEMNVTMTYLLDVRVLQPMPDTLEAKRLEAVRDTFKARIEAAKKNTNGVWRPLGEPR